MAYVCGDYDRKAKTIRGLSFLVLVVEELKEGYVSGSSIYIGQKEYILTNRRFVAPGVVVQYDMILKKG